MSIPETTNSSPIWLKDSNKLIWADIKKKHLGQPLVKIYRDVFTNTEL